MKHGKTIVIIFLQLILASAGLFAQEEKKNDEKKDVPDSRVKTINVELSDQAAFVVQGQTVTLGGAIKMVLEQNRDILSGAYDVAMSDSLYKKFQKKYAAFINLEGGYKYQKFPEEMGPFVGVDQTTIDLQAAVSKMFYTGTTLSAGLKHEYIDITKEDINFGGAIIPADRFGATEYHQPVMFVSIQQELLKNSFGYNERRQQDMLKNAGKMQREMLLFQLSGLVVEAVVDYWTVIISISGLDNAELQLRETKKVRNIIASNVRLGLSESFELNFYNSLVASADARASNAMQHYRDNLKKLMRTLNLDSDALITGNVILSDKLPELNESGALKIAFEKRADYLNALLSLKNAQMELEMYSNEAMPSVTAELNLSTIGQREKINNAYSDTSSAKYPAWEARVKVTYPLGDSEQKTNERNAKYRVKQADLQLEKYKKIVRDDVVSKIEHIKTFHNLYEKAKYARRQSETYYYRLLNNLRRGRFTAAVVKNGLDAMVESRQRELEALVQYNVALLQFVVSKNQLFDYYNIKVDDYLPKED